jgi:hypothetical protein
LTKNDDTKKIYIRPEDTLEFLYEILDNYKTIEKLKQDLRKMAKIFSISE